METIMSLGPGGSGMFVTPPPPVSCSGQRGRPGAPGVIGFVRRSFGGRADGQFAPFPVAVVDQASGGRDEGPEFLCLVVDLSGGGVGAEDAPAELDRGG